MQAVTTVGLDIAKSVFQVHGVDADPIRAEHYGQPHHRTNRPDT